MKNIRRRLSASIAAGSMTAALSVTLLATSPAHADGAAACADTSSKGGVISPCMMIARAYNWIAAGVPYDQGGWYASPSGDGTYREDCAGFVAMAWHMKWSPPVTYAPPGLDDPSISKYLGTVSSLKNAGSLDTIQPGDALVLTGEHVVLFAGWTDSSHTSAVIDSESHTGVPTSQSAGLYAWSTKYLIGEGYKVYRYNNDQLSNPASPPTTTVDSASVTNSAVTLTGTASPGADYFYFHVQQNGVDKLYSPAVAGTPGTPHHTWSFDPKSLPNGTYQVIASASLNGQIGTSAGYNITINNAPAAPPAPSVSSPSGIATGVVAMTASAPGANSVTYSVDGAVVGTSTSGPDFSLEWDSAAVPNGLHSITATASNGSATSPVSSTVKTDVEDSRRDVGVITPSASDATSTKVGDANGQMHVFSRGADGHLYDSYAMPGGAWNLYDLTKYGGAPAISGAPAAVVDSSGVLNVFSRGANGHLYDTYAAAGAAWNDFDLTAQGGAPTIGTDPAVTVDSSGTMNVFTRGADGHLYDTYAQAGAVWNDFDLTAQGGAPTITNNPAVTVDSSATMNVFTRGADGHLYDSYAKAGGTWNDYDLTAQAGAPTITNNPAVTVDTSGTMNVFTRGADGHLYDSYAKSGGTWNDYDLTAQAGAPTITNNPAVTVDTSGTMNVFARGADGHLYDSYAKAGGTWNDYDLTAQAGAPTIVNEPSVTVDTSGTMNVFTRGADGHLYDSYAKAGGTWNDYDLTSGASVPVM
ncbi:hypothetical protein ABH920_000308 [Catenulispora sp. EB89]|uniref:Ig-like domain-containing protein n=1 Tax=Catenulispora sp. EB89 TaxID=3156257 RepID=UPI003511C1A5